MNLFDLILKYYVTPCKEGDRKEDMITFTQVENRFELNNLIKLIFTLGWEISCNKLCSYEDEFVQNVIWSCQY